ncbi:MAG: hypothetical protein ABI809_10815 [Caldimonas sp.]
MIASPATDSTANASSGWKLGGSAPPSVIASITEISAMPSPMQWCTRATSALPPS